LSGRAIAVGTLTAVLVGAIIPSTILAGGPSPTGRSFPGALVPVYAGHTMQTYEPIGASLQRSASAASLDVLTPSATIKVTYHGFSAKAQAAFQAAVNVWAAAISSSQVIHIDASWTGLGATSGVLGQAGATNFYADVDGFVYPAALEEARCGCNANTGPEITAQFNSQFSGWYYGTDGNVPGTRWDLFTVVLHELGHGLGFMGSFDVVDTRGFWGFSDGTTNYPLRFDADEWSAATAGSHLISYRNGGTGLKSQLTDGTVFFGGPNLVAALGKRAKLYAPSQWVPGSSNSHLDERAFPPGTKNALMTPVLNNGEAIHTPGAVTLAIFEDIGWTTHGAGTNVTAPAAGMPSVNLVAQQRVTSTALARVSWPPATDESRARATDGVNKVAAWTTTGAKTSAAVHEKDARIAYAATWRT
jgi:hypothetical protein